MILPALGGSIAQAARDIGTMRFFDGHDDALARLWQTGGDPAASPAPARTRAGPAFRENGRPAELLPDPLAPGRATGRAASDGIDPAACIGRGNLVDVMARHFERAA